MGFAAASRRRWSLPAPALVSASLDMTGDTALGDTRAGSAQIHTHQQDRGVPKCEPQMVPGSSQALHPPPREKEIHSHMNW